MTPILTAPYYVAGIKDSYWTADAIISAHSDSMEVLGK